jgi:hypothetical protein
MLAEYSAKSAALTAAYDAECNAPPTAEQIAAAEIRRAEIAAEKAAQAEIAADNASAIELLGSLLPLTVEQCESLPHFKTELVDRACPKYGAVIKSHRAPSRYGHGTCTYSWVVQVSAKEITLAMVQALIR